MAVITYQFPDYDTDDFREFDYDIPTEDFEEWIKNNLPLDVQIDIYMDVLYKKDERERKMMLDDFGLHTEQEVRDFLFEDEYSSEMLLTIFSESDVLSDYICKEYEYELQEEFKDDAEEAWGEELEAELDNEALRDEIDSYWRRTRF